MSSRQDPQEFDRLANEAATAFCNRTGWQAPELPHERLQDLDFRHWLRSEKDREALAAQDAEDSLARSEGRAPEVLGSEISSYDMEQRLMGVRAFARYLSRLGLHPAMIIRQLFAAFRAMHLPPFCDLTMQEVAALEGDTPASHSLRVQIYTGAVKLAGMSGGKAPGQKTPAAVKSYQACRKGNGNRKPGRRINGKKVTHHKPTKTNNQTPS